MASPADLVLLLLISLAAVTATYRLVDLLGMSASRRSWRVG